MNAVRALTLSDVKNIGREPLLRFLVLYPLLLGLVMRWLIPFATERLADVFDLMQYTYLISAFFGVLVTPLLGGFAAGLLLLDERDSGTLSALQVTPFSMGNYFVYRLTMPVVVSLAAGFVVVWLMGLVPVNFVQLAPIALLAALGAPLYALLLASFASNKVQGLAIAKGLGIFLMAPIVAWFVPLPWQYLLGVFPTYWPAKAYWVMLEGGSSWPYLVVGLAYHLALLWMLLRHFRRVVYQG